MASSQSLAEARRIALAAYGLYRRYITTVSLAPVPIRKKLGSNIHSMFVIARHAELTTEEQWALIERGEKDLLLLQRVILLPNDLLKPLTFRYTSGMMPDPSKQQQKQEEEN